MRLKVKTTPPTARIVIVGVRSSCCGQSGRKNCAPRFVALKFRRACPSQPTVAALAARRRMETHSGMKNVKNIRPRFLQAKQDVKKNSLNDQLNVSVGSRRARKRY